MLERWIETLPEEVREIMLIAGDTVEKFDGDVKMMATLAGLAFKRAVDSESGKTTLEPKEQTELLKVAGVLVQGAAKLKERRLEVMDRFDNISDMPQPANLNYMTITESPAGQVRRLLLAKMDMEAEAVARHHRLDLELIRSEVDSERPE